MIPGNVLVWNCRGIVNLETQRALIDLVQAKRPYLVFLAETLATPNLINSLTSRLGFENNICFQKEQDSQGLALMWSHDLHVDLRSKSPHHIDAAVREIETGKIWRFTGVYGFAAREDRHKTWDLIETLASEVCSLPLLMAGDFNELLTRTDKSGGPPRAFAPMAQFRNTMAAAGLVDMGFYGCRYTWFNKFTKERLDRSFCSAAWKSLFPLSRTLTLPPSDSDHNPLLIEVRAEHVQIRRGSRRFRFEECWYGHERCTSIIKQNWSTPLTGNLLQQMESKINSTGQQLLQWHAVDFQKHKIELREIQEKLHDIMRQPYSPWQYEEQRMLHSRQSQLLSIQEKYWRQRSRAVWLKDGDRNSAYFHRKASNRKSRNTIRGLQNEEGIWTNDPHEIRRLLMDFYNMTFTSEGVDDSAISEVFRATPLRVTELMNDDLLLPYSNEEIKAALFQMHPSKSPGPDGMSPFFFQKYWHIVGFDVCVAIRNFLEHGDIWRDSNFTHICLIPKVKSPTTASHFRPIALCNVIYRISSKVIANRLKKWLPEIISPLQSDYVPGRLISDNTLVATEAAHFMHKLKSQEDGFFSLKLDISKAYDRLEWPFLSAMLVKLGFSSKWVNMVMSCVTSVSYALLIQGEPSDTIFPTRGIRQGDPLSPYLFILCAEGLSALISQAVESGAIQGLKMCPQAPILHHLFFADDSILFGAATVEECLIYRNILNTYERASGQKVNLQKSSVVFSRNVPAETQEMLAALLEVKCEKEHDRYLGLPLRVGRSKTQIFHYIKEKLSKKLENWKAKILSCAGKEILIKAVAQTMPLYAMNCYLLPKTLCDDIHKLCASFFWGDTKDKKKIHWRSWERLCLIKHERGMGFKNIYAYNLAMLAKQGWRLVTNPSSLIARLYKAKYFPNCEFWQAELGDAPSFSWRSILAGRPVLKAGIRWRVGDGVNIRIWHDQWVPNCPQSLIQKPSESPVEYVADLIDFQTRQWIPDIIHATFHPLVATQILCIPLGRHGTPDKQYWNLDKRGWFTVTSAYWIAREHVLGNALASTSTGDPFKELWRKLWRAQVPGKVKICVWRACCNLLPTRDRLTTKGYDGLLNCPLCDHQIEDTYHTFCKCPTAYTLLSQAPFYLQHSLLPQIPFKEWMLSQAVSLKAEVFAKLMMLIWGLWTNRNTMLWEGTTRTAADIFFSTMTWLEEFQRATSTDTTPSHRSTQVWRPASEHDLKLNVDGAFISQLTRGGIGGVLRNSNGVVVAAFQSAVQYASSALQVELLAIQTGLVFVQQQGTHSVLVETDCQRAVHDINGSAAILSEHGILVEDIRNTLRRMPQVKVSFAPRTCNKVAHRLANLAFESQQCNNWVNHGPDCITDLVQKELLPPS